MLILKKKKKKLWVVILAFWVKKNGRLTSSVERSKENLLSRKCGYSEFGLNNRDESKVGARLGQVV